jgi:hypothetical protein
MRARRRGACATRSPPDPVVHTLDRGMKRRRSEQYDEPDFEDWVIATRRAQGLPDRIEDPVVLAQVAALLRGATANPQGAPPLVPEQRRPSDRALDRSSPIIFSNHGEDTRNLGRPAG